MERLVARDALGARHGAHARSRTGRCGARPTSAASRCSRCPAGFSYVTFSHTGSTMSDGNPTPLALDGMGAFAAAAGTTATGTATATATATAATASCGWSATPRTATRSASTAGCSATAARRTTRRGFGGTTTLVYDERRRELVEDFVSLNGTIVNCAGGRAYRYRYWLTGEETVAGPDAADPTVRFPKRHGYLFETPVDRGPDELEIGEPIVAAGRFSHEAAAVDQRTGIVYETEDPGSGVGAGFYRYTPDDPEDLTAGGTLRDARDRGPAAGRPARGPAARAPAARSSGSTSTSPTPTSRRSATRAARSTRAGAQGGAKFNRLEGCWEDDGTIFFVSTSGGDAKNGDVNSDGYEEGFGQVWAYRPGHRRDGGTLVLVYESPSGAKLRRAGQPHGHAARRAARVRGRPVVGVRTEDTHPLAPGIENVNRLIGITRRGEAFEFAVNVLNGSELAGVCFSPSGETLFFNLFGRARFDEDPVRGDDLRGHGAVAPRTVVIRSRRPTAHALERSPT